MKTIIGVLIAISTLPTLCQAQSTAPDKKESTEVKIEAPASKPQAALPMAANPDGIAALDFKAEFEAAIPANLDYFQEKCGYALITDFNLANLSQGTSEEDHRSVASYCAAPLNNLATICEKGESYKAIVAKKIKKFTCHFLGNTAKRTLSLEGDNLIWSFEYQTEHSEDQNTYLDKVLMGLL